MCHHILPSWINIALFKDYSHCPPVMRHKMLPSLLSGYKLLLIYCWNRLEAGKWIFNWPITWVLQSPKYSSEENLFGTSPASDIHFCTQWWEIRICLTLAQGKPQRVMLLFTWLLVRGAEDASTSFWCHGKAPLWRKYACLSQMGQVAF